jgi:hypothetical protein
MILVSATWNETKVAWCPYIFVDNDAALARGWIQGFPKKIGSIAQTRAIGVPSPCCSLGRAGRALCGERVGCGSSIGRGRGDTRETTGRRISVVSPNREPPLLPAADCRQASGARCQRTRYVCSRRLEIDNAWTGKGRLTLPDAPGEEIADLAPERIGPGFRASLSYTVRDLRVLADLRHCERQ